MQNNQGGSYPGYPGSPPAPPPQVVVVEVQPLNLGHDPAYITCPYCHSSITTEVSYDSSFGTHCCAIALCFLCGIAGCIPYCCSSCKTATHTCPVCKHTLSSHD